jgi:hypothetical protein
MLILITQLRLPTPPSGKKTPVNTNIFYPCMSGLMNSLIILAHYAASRVTPET